MNNLVNQQPVQTSQLGFVPQGQPQVGQPLVQNTVVQPNPQGQATFTQEQVNGIVQNRVNALNQKVSELTNQLAQSQQLANTYYTELTGFKQREAVINAGVPSQFVDFAVFESNKLAVNGKSFDDAVKEYVTANQQLFVSPQIQSNQVAPAITPSGVAPTQPAVAATQIAPVQQQTPVVQNNIQPASATVASAQPVVAQPIGVIPNTNVCAIPQTGAAVPVGVSQVQTGATGNMGYGMTSGALSPNTVDSAVSAFLKGKGIGTK